MKRTLSALAILLVLTSGFYWKLTLTREWTFLEGPDLAIQVRPWLDYCARQFHSGRIPLWDPYEWAGHTLIGQVQPGIANPLNWILFAMPLREGHIPVTTLHWYWVLIHWLGAVFAYALCRDIGARFVASLFGGCVFALTGFLGHTDWPQILLASIWIPVVLLFFFRVTRGQSPASSAALAGSAMGISFLGTHHVVPTFTALLVCAMWIVLIVQRPQRVRYFAIFLCITAGVAAVQVLPALEYSRLAIRWAGAPDPILPGQQVPFSVHAEYSLKWRELPAMLLPRGATHVNPYVGLTSFACVLIAFKRRRNQATLWLAALAPGALAIALASPPYWLIWRFAPMVEKAREPAFAIVIAQVALATLAALGLSGLPRWAAPVALALFLGEAANHAPNFQRFDRRDSYTQRQRDQLPVMRYLLAQTGWFRVDFDDAEVPYNAGDLYGIEQFGGAVSSMPLRVHRVLGHQDTPRTFGIRYRVGRTPSHPDQVEVFRAPNGLAVFLDPRGAVEPMWGIAPCATEFHLLGREPHRVDLDARMPCEGLAIIGDPYYPGWRAYVDGRRVPIQEVEGVRAVRLTAGRHRIEYLYRPFSVYVGLALTIAALLITAVLAARSSSPTPSSPR